MRAITAVLGLFVLFGASSLVACAPPTEIVVTVTTDVPCTASIETAVSVGLTSAEAESLPPSTTSSQCTNGRVGAVVLTPSSDRNGMVSFRVVMGITRPAETCAAAGYAGCVVARRALRYVPGRQLNVPIKLEDACRGVVCSPDTTCGAGRCVPVTTECSDDTCAPNEGPLPTRWKPMASVPDCGNPFTSAFNSWAWTGDEVVVWGGGTAHGAAYRPSTDQWRCVSGSTIPAVRAPVTVWMPTVGKVFVWGGQSSGDPRVAGAWDPKADTWSYAPASPPELNGFIGATGVWSPATREVIVWGGLDDKNHAVNRGGAYSPETNTWRLLPLDPPQTPGFFEVGLAAVDARIVRFGGMQYEGVTEAPYAVYDPKVDRWTTPAGATVPIRNEVLTVPTPGAALFWGGRSGGTPAPYDDGVLIDANGGLTKLASPPPGVARWAARGWYSHGRAWFWGGSNVNQASSADNALADGWSYELATKTWTPMPTANAPSKRTSPVVVWTGTMAIVWGGYDGTFAVRTDGALFTP